ncbi:fancd2 [Rhynchophorus ferrugineus]|uniref:fancd2 n=1 Tax=Rhynchophorus ferrugineus TaxID=354439 RepID=UPI003FCDCEFF
MQMHVALLMQLLEKLDCLDLKNVKIVFDILCILTCENSQDSLSGFKNEIHIFIRKLLSSSERTVKHRGIISALVMVKHMASVDPDLDTSCSIDESLSIIDIPENNAKEAAFLVELINTCTGNCPELLGLFYDQLASILASPYYFDKYFLYWLYDTSTSHFKELFITDTVPDSKNDFTFTMQYASCDSEEMFPLAVDIASYTIWKKSDTILLLAPFFRVVRLLHSRQHNENLSTLDDLLICGIVLPDVSDPETLDFEGTKQVVDCLFHSANWIRELISAFVTQKNVTTQLRVVQRLKDLIHIEEKINNFLNYVPGHNLPVSYFESLMNTSKQVVKAEVQSNKNPRKKLKSSSIINETAATTAGTQPASKPRKGTKASKVPTSKIQYREIDTDVIILMKYPLIIDNEERHNSSQSISLNLEEVKFLLEDFKTKISILTENRDISLRHLNDVIPEHFIKDSVHIFPYINDYLDVIVKHIGYLMKNMDDRQDLPSWFTEEALNVKLCFGYLLNIFYLVFKWPGFQMSSNLDLLKQLLKALTSKNSQAVYSVGKLITDFVLRLGMYTKECSHLSQAVHLIRTMEVMYQIVMPNEEIKKKMAKTAEILLNRRWYSYDGNLDKGKECNENINILIRISLCTFNVKKTYGLVETIRAQVEDLTSNTDCLTSLMAINKQNFHVFYLGLCNVLLESVKTEVHHLTNKQHLELWNNVAHTMQSLKEIAKSIETRANLVCFLKKSVAILKVFLSHGVPILEIMLKNKPTEVSGIFRTLQESTRYLHSLCCESKVNKDARVVTYIPAFRHILESLVYRVKAALVANNLSEVFILGSLKNKRLDGKELSQESESSSTGDADDTYEHLPSDNEDISIIVDESTVDTESHNSEVYN